MADIFISYAHDDRATVREFVRLFEDNDWTVFWDRDIAIGVDFQQQIERELGDAKCVVVVWSEASFDSTWVRAESSVALDRGTLLPIRIDQCQLPMLFRGIETADLRDWPTVTNAIEVRKLLATVEQLVHSVERSQRPNSSRIRDDPTLSARVARRVVDELGNRDQARLRLESICLDLAIERSRGTSLQHVMETNMEVLADALGATTLLIQSSGELRVLTGDVASAAKLMSLARRPSTGTVLLTKSEIGVGCKVDWCLFVSVAKAATTFVFAGTGDQPNIGLVSRLGHVIAQLERPSAD